MDEKIFIPILLGLGLYATILGIRYLQNQENMLMIQNGMDPRTQKPKSPTFTTIKIGLLLIGAGLGLLVAYILDFTIFNFNRSNNPPLYFSLIAIFGGLGLFISHLIEIKESKKN